MSDPHNLGLLIANLRRAARGDAEIDAAFVCHRAADLLSLKAEGERLKAESERQSDSAFRLQPSAFRGPPREPDAPPRWEDRLVMDPNVSDDSPCVKGSWITAKHVVSLVVDGWTWTDILCAHPELTEDDIRACLAYAVEITGSPDDGPRKEADDA